MLKNPIVRLNKKEVDLEEKFKNMSYEKSNKITQKNNYINTILL
jgi:hypothetical protein